MKIVANNKYVRSDYEILEKYEAGIVLLGWEVKSIRAGEINLKNSYCLFQGNELFLTNAHINLYMAVPGDEMRNRKLLLHKNQLLRIKHKVEQNSLTIVPLKIYFTTKSYLKIEIAVVRAYKKHDKRQVLKERDLQREIKNV